MDELLKLFHTLCAPAKLYIVLSLMSTTILIFSALNKKNPVVNTKKIILFLLGACVWTYILNSICSYGWEILSWILVLSPLIITVITMMIAFFWK